MRAAVTLGLATSVAGFLLLADTPIARACGCLSPPQPPPDVADTFAVNQQSEQIIFEVEPGGWVTAHVLIKYAGDPASFAWIVPVPEVPELGISPVSAFGLLDSATAPDVSVITDDICPISEWSCAYHNQASCSSIFEQGTRGDDSSGNGASASDAGAASGSPVTVISEQVIGDYQTVTFQATEAAAATQWLRDNGFIVNQTTSIYMEAYVQQNMVFVAAKLVPGAGIKAIKPLRLRYRAAYPSVPLILTAVASEPHLTVTSFIYSDTATKPMGHPVVRIDETRIAQDTKGRTNYPQVLARTIDEAGGKAFAIEYRGGPVQPNLNQYDFCCSNGFDSCGIGNNGSCECPLADHDANDCENVGDLVEGADLLNALSAKYSALTRITTRVSAEEMTFDPTFVPDETFAYERLTLRGRQASLGSCAGAVIDTQAFSTLDAQQNCAATYCGTGGHCVVTTSGAACECDATFVAQRFTDLDGAASVTCVPKTPPVDLRAEGEILPDACAGKSCGDGTCVDRNGVAVCECAAGAAAAPGGTLPICETIVVETATPGAEDYSESLRDLEVCAPRPPVCGPGGWLVKTGSPRVGVDCGDGIDPPDALTHPGPRPTCGGVFGGCACSTGSSDPAPLSMLLMTGLVGFWMLRRRSGRQGR